MDREKEVKVNVVDLTLLKTESSERKETRSLALEYQDKFQLLEAKLAKISQEIVDLKTEKVTVTDFRPKSEIERLKLVEKLKISQDKELKDQSQSLVVEYQVKIQELEAKVAKLSQENVDLRIEKTMVTEDLMQKRLQCDQLAEELRRNNLEVIKTESGFRLKALESPTHGLTSAVAREVQNVYLSVSEGEKNYLGDGENADSLGSLVLPNKGASNSIGQSTGAILSGSRVHLESYKVIQDDRHKAPQDSGQEDCNRLRPLSYRVTNMASSLSSDPNMTVAFNLAKKAPLQVNPCAELSPSQTLEKPYEGMLFDSLKEAGEYYEEYSRQQGFWTRIRSSYKTKQRCNEVTSRVYVCVHHGKYATDGPTKKVMEMDEETPSTEKQDMRNKRKRTRWTIKSGCPASFRVTLDNYRFKWKVTVFNDDHNHKPVTPCKRMKMKSKKRMSTVVKDLTEA